MLPLIIIVFGFVVFVLAGFGVPTPPRLNLGWFGLACWALAAILTKTPGL